MNIPAGTSDGQHFIGIRIMNTEWGLFDFYTITVSGALPLQLLSFDACKTGKTVLLKWKTEIGINTSHFDVEKSSNGVQFEKIGQVASANGMGSHHYSLEDTQPVNGMHFYRIKQVDKDGSFTYSRINKVLFNSIADVVKNILTLQRILF